MRIISPPGSNDLSDLTERIYRSTSINGVYLTKALPTMLSLSSDLNQQENLRSSIDSLEQASTSWTSQSVNKRLKESGCVHPLIARHW